MECVDAENKQDDNVDDIQVALPCNVTVHFVDTCESTNDLAIEAGRSGAPHGAACATCCQTQGRGRRGHSWQTPQGNLALSIVLRPQIASHLFIVLPTLVAMGVYDALQEMGLKNRVGIKWPNDIVATTADNLADPVEFIAPVDRPCYDRKLAGVLVEAKVSQQGPFAVAGIGLNLHAFSCEQARCTHNQQDPVATLEPISLDELVEGEIVAEKLAVYITFYVLKRVDAYATSVKAGRTAAGPMAPILSEYFDMIPMLGKYVVALKSDGAPAMVGTFGGIDTWGRAILVDDQGKEHAFASEVVSLREV